jgi:hypothetical protein
MEMDHSKMEGMKDDMQERSCNGWFCKKDMEGEMKMEEWICFRIQLWLPKVTRQTILLMHQ